MAKTTPTAASPVLVVSFAAPERDSKNYDVFGTLDLAATGGKSPILVGNDGRVYVHKTLAAAKTGVTLTLTLGA